MIPSKDEIIRSFPSEDVEDVVKIYQWMNVAYTRDIPMFSNFFCKPNIWSYFIDKFDNKGITVQADGAYEECDKKMLAFNIYEGMEMPYVIIKIINKSKFNKLLHKDYLGAILGCGVRREKLGDLRVHENYAIVPICSEIIHYVSGQLTSVGKAPVEVVEITKDDLPKQEFKEEVIIISSLRVDNFVTKLSNTSRTKAIDLIAAGKVLVEYRKVKDKSQEIKEGQRMTISGIGKFIVGPINGSTKSGRYRVIIKKYI